MITGEGESVSTLQAQESACKCYEKYAESNGLQKLEENTRDDFCCEELHQKFAYYLTSVYKIKNKGFLSCGTVLNYIGYIMVIGQSQLFKGIFKDIVRLFGISPIVMYSFLIDHFLGDPFFKGLDNTGNWYTRMRCGVESSETAAHKN